MHNMLRTMLYAIIVCSLTVFLLVNLSKNNINLPKSYKEGFDTSNLSDEASKIVGTWYGEEISQKTPDTKMSGIFYFYSNGTGEVMINVLDKRTQHTTFTYTYDFKNKKLDIVTKNQILSFDINNIDNNSLTIIDENSKATYVKIDYDHK